MPNPIPALTEALEKAKRDETLQKRFDVIASYNDGLFTREEATFKLMDTGLTDNQAEMALANCHD